MSGDVVFDEFSKLGVKIEEAFREVFDKLILVLKQMEFSLDGPSGTLRRL